MYRPDGWPELDEHPCSGDGCLECRDYANREAGADAIVDDVNDWLKPLGLVFKQYPDEGGLYHISGRDDKW